MKHEASILYYLYIRFKIKTFKIIFIIIKTIANSNHILLKFYLPKCGLFGEDEEMLLDTPFNF